MRISDWSSDVCSSDLPARRQRQRGCLARTPDQDRRGAHLQIRRRARPAARAETRGGAVAARLRRARQGGAAADAPRMEFRRAALLPRIRSEEHTSELQSLMRISYAVFCLKKKNKKKQETQN